MLILETVYHAIHVKGIRNKGQIKQKWYFLLATTLFILILILGLAVECTISLHIN